MKIINFCFYRFYAVWLLILPILYLASPIDVPYLFRFAGVIFFIFLFYPFFALNKGKKKLTIYYEYNVSTRFLISLICIQWLCGHYALIFYTGSSIYGSIVDLISGANSYISYQEHFSNSNIRGSGALTRIPAILSLAFVKFTFLSVLSLFFLGFIRNFSFPILLFSIFPYFIFGMGRGTFFEVFEIFVALVFFSYMSDYSRMLSVKKKALLKIFAFFSFLLIPVFFIANTLRRFDNVESYFARSCNGNFCFEPYGLITSIEYLIYIFSNYFSMGLFFISGFFVKLIEGSFISSLLPMYISVNEGAVDGVRSLLCSEYSCSFVWVPDIFIVISLFGILTPFFLLVILKFSFFLEWRILKLFNIYSMPLLYFLFIFLLSLPVGNFYTVSSSSILSSFVFFLLWLFSKKGTAINKEC